MEILTKNSRKKEFLTRAHIVICASAPNFTLEDVYNRMRLTCDETVSFETIRESVDVLIKYLIEAGWISKVNENEYVNHLTEKESTI